jgi:hypothetical protein
MNLLSTILDRLNQRIEVGNIFDQIYGLSEPVGEGNDKAWAFYIGNGQAIPVTNFDAKQGTLFWAKRGKITVAKNDSLRLAGCKSIYETRFSMTAYAMVRKSHLPCDSADAQDWIASRVLRLISGTDPQFKAAIGVIAYEVVPSGYQNEIRYLPVNYEWAAVAIDVDVNVSTSSEDGCYDTCATGDIPLPDFEPCTPCLTEVAVDGVTIIGNGTPADPLVAVGGGGGTPLRTQEEGTNVSTNTTTLNFTGAGVTASLTSPGVVEVNVPGGGAGGEDLQQTTDIGNTTTNNIAFTGTAGLSFDNGAFIRKGTTDAGNGGAKGTAQICSISYELKWEAGRLYYMEQDGFTIRDVTHNFTLVPQVTDDSSKGFVVGSRWSLDDSTVYVCSDATIGAAVWAVVSVVSDVTATAPLSSSGGTTPDISITQADTTTDGYLSSADWNTFNGKFDTPTGTSSDYLDGTGAPQPFPTLTNGTVTSVATAGLISGGPITTSGTITTAMTTNKLVGRATAGSGIMEEITVGSGLTLTGAGVLNNTATPTPTGYYGAFQDDTTQTAVSANTAYPVKFNTIDLSNGVTVVNDGSANPTRVTIANTGIYNVQFSLQLEKTGGSGNFIIDIWLRKNGVDIPDTAGKVVLTGSANASPIVAAWNYLLNLAGGDYVQLMWSTTNNNAIILAEGPVAPHPGVPSSILTVTQQAGIMAGTGITAINSLTGAVQTIGTGTTGTDFAVVSSGTSHTFNLPTASASNRGALSTADWTTFNGKFNTPTGTTSQYVRGDGTLASLPFELVVAASDETTALTAGTAKITFRMPRAVTLTSVRASLTTAQASGNIFTVDINEGGTSILSTKLTIDNTEKTSSTAATPPVISDTTLADDAEITIDIDQIGNGTATGLKVMLIGTYA